MEQEGIISDQNPLQSYPTLTPKKKGGNGKLWLLIIVVVVAIAAFLFLRPQSTTPTQTVQTSTTPTQEVEQITVTETPESSQTTPTPTEKVAPTKKVAGPSIQVQNGSGEEGVAGKMKTAIEDLGYDNVETANADNYDYKNVTIKAKDASSSEATKLKSLLKDYTVEKEVATLSEDSSFDIIVIVGK